MILFSEVFGGTLALTRILVGGMRNNRPLLNAPTGYMGAKNELGDRILRAAHLRPGRGAEHLVWNDGSTIGRIWPILLGPEGLAVTAILRSWEGEDPRKLWLRLWEADAPTDPVEMAASWLWLQARAASGVPVWWRDDEVVAMNGDGNGPYRAFQKGKKLVSMDGHGRGPYPAWQATCKPKLVRADGEGPPAQKGRDGAVLGGIKSPTTVAKRIETIRSAFCGRSWKAHSLLANEFVYDCLIPQVKIWTARGHRAVVYLDPPYVSGTGYELKCPRVEVTLMALALRTAGASVIVSEAEGLPLPGWHQEQLPSRRKPEWITMSDPPPAESERGDLFVGGAA